MKSEAMSRLSGEPGTLRRKAVFAILGGGFVIAKALLLYHEGFRDMPPPEQLRRQLDSAFPAYEEAARLCVRYPGLGRVDGPDMRFSQSHLRDNALVPPDIAKRTFRFMADQGIDTIRCGRLYKDGVPELVSVGFRFVEDRYFMTARFISLTRVFPNSFTPVNKTPAEDRIPEHPGWEFFRSR